MCGIAGILNFGVHSNEQLYQICSQMTDILMHRGPDDEGVWQDPRALVALGHRRLSILDLSPEGHQPMLSLSGRYIISYNGEIYNYLDVRKRLEEHGQAPIFRGHSDTEVVLASIDAWGLEKAVNEFSGIFAFALWDQKEQVLSLVRDRVGVKPIYYGWGGKSLVFGSELKALRKHPDFDNAIDRGALALYFRHNYIPAPYSIYEKTFKLLPGHILKIRPNEDYFDKLKPLPSTVYWSARDVWLHGGLNQWQGNDNEAVDALDNLLRDAVKSQMISDVPLGAFLSGGIDSSTVTALMQSQSCRPVKTVSIGFREADYNEAVFAKNIANYLGTDHTELYVTDKEAQEVIPLLPSMYDEPFADSSQIPMYLVSKLAKGQVTVSLSGDGGDELFSGYNRYMEADRLWRLVNSYPRILRQLSGRIIDQLPVKALDILGYPLNLITKSVGLKTGRIGYRLKKYSGLLSQGASLANYRSSVSYFSASENPVLNGKEPKTIFSSDSAFEDNLDHYQLMSLVDVLTYLPDDILVKVDRASMAVALEVRVPILDHCVVEFAAALPTELKIRNLSGKWILKKLLNRYIPEKLTARSKMGFAVPIGAWLRGPLKEWAIDLLEENTIYRDSFLDRKKVTSIWNDHISRQDDWSFQLWGVLMFQSWLNYQIR